MHTEHKSCFDACVECAAECQHCGSACIDENRPETAKLTLQCAEICYSSAISMGAGASYSKAICGVCAEVCDDCAAECEKYSSIEHCRRCAEACHRCAEECRSMAGIAARVAATAAT